MNNFKPGGLRKRRPDLGGRPQSDADYRTNKRFDNKPRFDSRDKKDVQLFQTTCTTCGKPCEVPFRPDGTKPVLCSACFATKNASPTNMSGNRDRFTPNERIGHKPDRSYGAPAAPTRPVTTNPADYALLTKQLNAVEAKVNQILELIKASETLVKALPIVAPAPKKAAKETPEESAEEAAPKKVRKPKKETVAKKVAKKKAVKKAAAKPKKKK